MTCSGSGTAIVGQYANTGSVVGTPPVGANVVADDPSHYFGIQPDVSIIKYTNGEDADVPPGPAIYEGEEVHWEYHVTNTGDIALTDVFVLDDQGAAVTCPGNTLSPDESMVCEADGFAEPGQYANLGTAFGTAPDSTTVTASDPSHYLGLTIAPGLDVEKSTNGADADSVPGPYVLVGDPVAWEYVVTNIGNVLLVGVGVVDDQGVAVLCPDDELDIGESMTCSAGGIAGTGQYGNLATASGTSSPGGEAVADSDPSHYFGSQPAIELSKRTNGQDADDPPGAYVPVGAPVTWNYVVANTGNVLLVDVGVSDDQGVDVSCPDTSLAAGETMICEGAGIAGAGLYANLGSVAGTPPVGDDVAASDPSHYFGTVPGISLEKFTNGQDADQPPGPIIPVDDAVAWTYAVANTGNVMLTGVSVTDDQGVAVSCPSTVLEPGQGMVCDAAGVAGAGPYANTGTAEGLSPAGEQVLASDASHYFGSDPQITLTKRTNGQDADSPPGVFVPVGQPVTWSYVVDNAGNVLLTGISVTDDQGVEVSCPQTTLDGGESMECEAAGTAQPGSYTNVGLVTATPPVGDDVTASDPSHYYGSDPGISIEKLTNGEDADEPPGPSILAGLPVEWTYEVTNSGNVTLSAVSVTDDHSLVVSCPDDTLSAGEVMTCLASGIAEAGPHANVGSVSGTPPVGEDEVASDASHYFGYASEPAISIEKRTNGSPADVPPGPYIAVGEPVEWSYLVGNPGNVALTDVLVTDDQGVTVSCPQSTLDVGETMTCLASGTAAAGQYSNIGTAVGTPPLGSDVTASDASHYYGSEPEISIDKLTNGEDADDPPGPFIRTGNPVLWSYIVRNVGNVTLASVQVTDEQGLDVTCPSTTLAPDETMTCEATSIAQAGQYSNIGTAVGTTPAGSEVTASDASHYFGSEPGISIEKLTNGEDADEPPGPVILASLDVEWTYLVTNTGNVSLTDLIVLDDQGLDVSCPLSSLPPGATMVCEAAGTAEAGQYANLGTATGLPPDGMGVAATDSSHYLGLALEPAIDVQKLTNGMDADSPSGPYILVGDPVTWDYLVTNVGNVSITDLAVEDDQGVHVSCPDDSLLVGESMVCTGTGSALAGQYSNLATVAGRSSPGQEVVTDTDLSHYFGSEPQIGVQKRTNGHDADEPPGPRIVAGLPVTWTYSVTNTGNVALTLLTVSDDQGVPVNCPEQVLAPGEVLVCSADGVAVVGQYANIGTATGAPPVGGVVSASDPSHYQGYAAEPVITLDKRTNGFSADEPPGPFVPIGEVVEWTYVVGNAGNVALTNLSVTDDQGATVSCPQSALGIGETMTCHALGTAVAGQYSNIGTAVGSPPVGSDATTSDTSHYYGSDPEISIEKLTNSEDSDGPPGPFIPIGEPVEWSYLVENAGNVALANVLVTDDQGVTVSCPKSTLNVGETMTCLASGTAEAGQYSNIGTAVGSPPVGSDATASDASYYVGVNPEHYIYLPLVSKNHRSLGRQGFWAAQH
jgi:hypothetical protein